MRPFTEPSLKTAMGTRSHEAGIASAKAPASTALVLSPREEAKYDVVKRASSDRNLPRALADCIDRMLTGRSTLEECLADYPELRPRLHKLLETALELHQAAAREEQRLATHRRRLLQRALYEVGRPTTSEDS
jgi:hypothetical protein